VSTHGPLLPDRAIPEYASAALKMPALDKLLALLHEDRIILTCSKTLSH